VGREKEAPCRGGGKGALPREWLRGVMERRTRTTPTQAWGAGAISGIYGAGAGEGHRPSLGHPEDRGGGQCTGIRGKCVLFWVSQLAAAKDGATPDRIYKQPFTTSNPPFVSKLLIFSTRHPLISNGLLIIGGQQHRRST